MNLSHANQRLVLDIGGQSPYIQSQVQGTRSIAQRGTAVKPSSETSEGFRFVGLRTMDTTNRWYRVGGLTTNSRTSAVAAGKARPCPVVEVLVAGNLKPTGERWQWLQGQWQRVLF